MDNINQILHTVVGVRHRLEKQEADRELIYAIAANSPVVVVDLNSELIEIATRPVEELFGYIDGELIGREIHLLVATEQRKIHKEHFDRYRNNPQVRRMGTQSMRLLGQHKDGGVFPVEIGLFPLVRDFRRLVIATVLGSSPTEGNSHKE